MKKKNISKSIIAKEQRLLIGKNIIDISIYRNIPNNSYLIENSLFIELYKYLWYCHSKFLNIKFIEVIEEIDEIIKFISLEVIPMYDLYVFYFKKPCFLHNFNYITNILYNIVCNNVCSDITLPIKLPNYEDITRISDNIHLLFKRSTDVQFTQGKGEINKLLNLLNKWYKKIQSTNPDILFTKFMKEKFETINDTNLYPISDILDYFRNIDNRILFGGGRNIDFEGERTTEFGNTPIIMNRLKQILDEIIIPEQNYTIDHVWSGIMGFGENMSLCHICKGIMKVIDNKVFPIDIRESQIIFKKEGNQSVIDEEPDNLIINIFSKPDDKYERIGNFDLLINYKVKQE
jgi:hypothetical protein